MSEQATCNLCGQPMPPGEEMFNYHGYSGPCPVPTPAPSREEASTEGHAVSPSVGAASQSDLSTTEAAAFKAGWQPIETAPRRSNDTRLLVSQPQPNGPRVTIANFAVMTNEWVSSGHRLNPQPTHWQPLPPPPVESKAGSVK